jgi:peptidoglycan-associated lipoprotein
MARKPSAWLVILICIVAAGLVVSGCAKKQVVKEEMGAKPIAKKEEVKPEAPRAVENPREEAPKAEVVPVVKPKEEARVEVVAKLEEKSTPIDLSALRIQFAFDDYSLSAQSQENLKKISTWMSKNPPTKIQIQGNTCDIGTAEYNLALGDRRANSAKQYLERLGVETARLSTLSYGEEKPRAPNTNEANRSLNRRDEFVESK